MSEFLFLLAKHKVRYLIVGGEAVIYYGHARLTGDIDLFYETTVRNVRLLFKMLGEFWNDRIPGVRTEEELLRQGMVFQFGIPPNRIDLITVVEGIEFGGAWERRQVERLVHKGRKYSIYYVGLDDLITNKQSVGRDRDRDDLKYLMEARRKRKMRRGRSESDL